MCSDVKRDVALVYDKFLVEGGGERVFGLIAATFPDAKIYTLNAHPKEFWEDKFGRKIITPPLGFLFRSRYTVILFYPLACMLMMLLKVNANVTIAYTSSCGKYIKFNSKISILYANHPNRGVFDTKAVIKSRLIRWILSPFIQVARFFELKQLKRFDKIYSISETACQAMYRYTGMTSTVLTCPYDKGFLGLLPTEIKVDSRSGEPSFLLISRLEPEKNIAYIIDIFRHLSFKLRVVGSGSQLKSLSDRASSNIKFLGFVQDADLVKEVLRCTAVIFPSDLEYSLVPIEANALGRPVVAYNSAAARELLIDVNSDSEFGSAVFYDSFDKSDLEFALNKAIKTDWKPENIKINANRFDPDVFKIKLTEILREI